MNTPPNKTDKNASLPKINFRTVLHSLPGRLWRMLRRNLLWKLFALFLSLCLWAGLITQDPTLTRERTFTDVPVSMAGAETLRRNGMIVLNDLQNQPLTVRMRVDVPQREYTTASVANYNPRIDLTKITQTGPQQLPISTTTTSTYGSVKELSPASVDVVVDEYITNYSIPVTIEATGQAPGGFYGSTPASAPASVTISGPRSVVDRIARVVVPYDASRLQAKAGFTRTALPMYFTDVDGNSIESDLIEVLSAGVLLRTISINQTLYPTKTLPLNSLALTTGTPVSGYEVRDIIATPNIIVAAGDEIALNALNALFVEQAVDISKYSESVTVDMQIRKPPELVYLSTDSIKVTIEIAPTISSREYKNIPIFITGQGRNLIASADIKTISAVLTGPSSLLDSLRASAISAYVDVSDLAEGTHERPLLLKISSADENSLTSAVTPQTAIVQITAK